MFQNCPSLKSIDLSSFNTNLVENFEFLFSGCKSLLSLNLYNFNTSLVKNMSQMFYECNSLIYLNISNFNSKSVTSMKYMFSNCNSLKSLELSSNFDASSVTDMEYMFSNCDSLTSLNLHFFKTSSAKTMNNMFTNCYSLKYLDISNFNTSSITNFQYMFSNCNSLKSLNLSGFDTSSVTNMENMFSHCFCLSSLNLSSFNTKSVTNMFNMFEECRDLLYLNFSNFFFNPSLNYTNIFKGINENIVYCLNNDDININKIISLLSSKECSINDCSYNWEENQGNKINDKNNNFSLFKDKCIYSRIKYISENFYLLNNIPNASIYSYKINSNIDKLKDNNHNLTFIQFTSDNINNIKKIFNLDSEKDNIYILVSDFPSNDSLSATSDYIFKIILENGTELNLSFIDADFYVNIVVPIRDLNLAKFYYASYFNEQGYDIYNKNSGFYYDLCTSAYYDKNDLIIKDRKKYIYPNNVTLCKTNCEYRMVNLDQQRISCECNLNYNKINNYKLNINNNKKDSDFLTESEEEFDNFGNLLLKNINYKIFKCSHLIFSFDNLIQNIGFYSISLVFIVMIFFNIKFFFFGLSGIRIKMFEETPTKEKVKKIMMEQLSKRKAYKNTTIKNNPFKRKIKVKFLTTCNNKNRKNSRSNKINKKNTSKDYLNIFQTNVSQNIGKRRIKKYLTDIRRERYVKKIYEKNNEVYDNLPFTKAIIEDNRSAFQLFERILFQKLELINLFMTKTKLKDILICEYILSLLIDFFFNTFFYSDDVISHKYLNNGKLDFAATLIITITSNVATAIICHFLNHSRWIEEKMDNILEIRIEYKYLYLLNKFFKYLKVKLAIFLAIEIIIVFFCFYYVVVFCAVYSQTQISLLINYIASLIEGLIKSIIVTLLIVITRKIGIKFLNVYSYNVSKYINSKF